MRHTERGFAYIGVIFAVAAVGIALAAVGELWSTQAQREREAELLRIGQEMRRAILSYHASTRPGTPAFPSSLDDLLEDRRGPVVRRHLRKLYADPMTRSTDWGLVKLPDGRLRGVHSQSALRPIKSAGFPAGLEFFAEAESYADWQFAYVVRQPAPPMKR